MIEEKIYSLETLCIALKRYIDSKVVQRTFWVTSEISKISENKGHYYLDLVDTKNEKVVAKMEATLWSDEYLALLQRFQDELPKILKEGNKVLLSVEVVYHTVYGLKLNIVSIDPSYTYGELELKKQQTIRQLTEKNLIGRNKEKKMPLVIKKVAVIGSPSTSGFTDFIDHLEKNNYGYFFYCQVFKTPVQGKNAEHEIIAQLKAADKYDFDAVVILRGGGSKIDLEVFNSFNICKQIALMRLPVITGIGHETDVTVADMVAHSRQKTPTAVAHFIIECATHFHALMQDRLNRITRQTQQKLSQSNEKLTSHSLVLQSRTKEYLTNRRNIIQQLKTSIYSLSINRVSKLESNTLLTLQKRLETYMKSKMALENGKLKALTNRFSILKPENILKRGYGITTMNGKVITSPAQMRKGDEIKTRLLRLTITSEVTQIETHE